MYEIHQMTKQELTRNFSWIIKLFYYFNIFSEPYPKQLLKAAYI